MIVRSYNADGAEANGFVNQKVIPLYRKKSDFATGFIKDKKQSSCHLRDRSFVLAEAVGFEPTSP